MSFRRRLTLFFVLIVVLPMVVLAVLVLQVAGSSRTGKADARLAAGLETALSVYEDELTDAQQATRDAARDPGLAAAIRAGDRARTKAALASIVRRGDLVAASVTRRGGGGGLAAAGAKETVADARLTLEQGGKPAGSLTGSVTTAIEYADRIRDLTGRDVMIWSERRTLAATSRLGDLSAPPPGTAETVEADGEELRVATANLGGGGPNGLRLTLVGDLDSAGFAATRPLVAAALAVFFVIALLFVAMLLRSLQGQVGGMLKAARKIGQGDFSTKVPVEGRDEMAGLASEFNQMSARLSDQMDELRRQRTELEQSVQRIGEAFASGLDRKALLEIVAETAVSACEAEHARIVLTPGREPEAEAGGPPEDSIGEASGEAERRALAEGAIGEAVVGGAYAIAHPLTDTGEGDTGVMSIARRRRPFDEGQRDVLRYLIGQAAVSIENVALHDLVAEQAVTDELTRLPNNRRFRSWIATEAARAERFGHELSLLILDIDDFKQVNDTFGHLQGDEVLRAIGRVLNEESRGVDEPARYGGEEFAIGLPETGLDGAVEFAERVRERIAATEIPKLDGDGSIRVTASFGAATAIADAADPRTLIEAADKALYRAKRGGKNRTERASSPMRGGDGRGNGAGKGPEASKIRGEG